MSVVVGKVTFDQKAPFVLIAGPCQIESRENVFEVASALKKITTELGIGFVFKSSFDKANRTGVDTPRGLGIGPGLNILADVRQEFAVPVLTDIHTAEQCARAAEVVDILQIPAFLSRQTDLLLAAGKTGKAVNIKKGQFLAPQDMKQVAAKVASTGNENILLTERGVSFGYNALVNDFRALPVMAETGYPVIFDATHSVQQPGGLGTQSGGQREFAPVLAKAALAVGVAGVFVETHPNPDQALSDGPNTLPLAAMADLLAQWKKLDDVAKSLPEVAL